MPDSKPKDLADHPVITAPVTVIAPEPVGPPPEAAKVGDKHAAPTTTEAEEEVKKGQRRINLIWESTQAIVAVAVTIATLWVAGQMALRADGDSAAFLLLSNAFFVVVTAYISRTNHSRTGGVKDGDVGR